MLDRNPESAVMSTSRPTTWPVEKEAAMATTEFIAYWRELNDTLYIRGERDADMGEAWPMWLDGIEPRSAAITIVMRR